MSLIAGQTYPDTQLELAFRRSGLRFVAGIDEAGRGALAGPVVAAAVVLPAEIEQAASALAGVRDSKLMAPEARLLAFNRILDVARASAVGTADHTEIDRWGIVPATRLAMRRAIQNLGLAPEHLLLDYMFLPDWPTPQTSLVQGDTRVLSIAAASVLAKVTRDRLMEDLDRQYPGYDLKSNKGYGTPAHKRRLEARGPCSIHRRTYGPVRLCLERSPAARSEGVLGT